MSFKKKHQEFYENEQINRWYLNMRARSPISADIWRRNLALYCELNDVTPEMIIEQAKDNSLKAHFQDFVIKMIDDGKKGAYVGKFKHTIGSWLSFNDIDYKIRINIPNENINETTENERVPTSDELARVLRKATSRGRVSISLMAFSGFRPEVLGSYEGSDGLMLGDIEDLDVEAIEFTVTPARINVRSNLSKARFRYFSFLGDEGCKYVTDYLHERKAAGETLTAESPLLVPNASNYKTKWKNLRTMLVTREIRDAIRSASLTMRPYILRAYFATALDIAESKGLISHPWRQFLMGHKGDIEAVYSTNKRPLPEKVDELRAAYLKASEYFETVPKPRDDSRRDFKEGFLESITFSYHLEIGGDEKERLLGLDFETMKEELSKIIGPGHESEDAAQAAISDRESLTKSTNGSRQKVVPLDAVETYVTEGFELVSFYPKGDKAIVRLP